MAAPAKTTLLGISTWPHALGKMIGKVADDDSIEQADLQVCTMIGFASGMFVQGKRANSKMDAIRNGQEGIKNFKYGLI